MVKFKKLIVSLLLVTFISSSIPLQVFAEEQGPTECNPQEIYTGDTDIKTNEKESTKLILEENIEKREENVKHFLLDDKTYEAVVYNESVHYREGEQWKDIDNTLEETIDEEVLSEEALSPEEELKIQGEELSNSITDEINGEEVINKEDSSNGKESINEEETANESTEEAVNESENVDETEKVDESSEVKEGENKVNQNQSEIEKSKGNTNNVFQNIANSFKLKIAKKADAKKLIRISRDNYEISWGIEGVSKVFSEVINTDENKVNELIEKNAEAQVNQNIDLKSKSIDVKNEEKQRIIENEKKKTLNKISSSVTYKEIFKDIDLNYKIVGDVVKENIIINKYTEKNEFVFNLKVKNLIAEKQQDNSIIFYDENDLTKKQFIIAAPFMIDSNNVTSSDVEVKIEEQNKGYKLTYIINKEWLKDSTRKYPVTLDPVVETSLSPTNIYDTFISKGNPNQNNVLAHILSVGYGQYSQETRSLISFNLPTLTAAESVIGAKFSLYLCDTDSYAGQIDIHKVNSSWNSNTVTWNNQPQFNSNIEDYQIMGNYGPYTWDITGIVKDWYVTGENNGLLVKHRHENPGYANINDYLSSDTSADFEAGRPQVTIFYINNSGIEGYWNYHSQAVGRAGVSYTNDFNGNVVHVHDDITMTGSRNPISIKHVYNSNNLGWDPSKPWFGRGW
ncbi:MAG: DNRLRE domain-containing protein, partial [Clostridium sp.]